MMTREHLAAGAASALEPDRPMLIAAGGLALVDAGLRTFWRAPAGSAADCGENAGGPEGSARRRPRPPLYRGGGGRGGKRS